MTQSGWATSSPDKYKPGATSQSTGAGSSTNGWGSGSSASGWSSGNSTNSWGSGSSANGWSSRGSTTSTSDWKSSTPWGSTASSWNTNTTDSKLTSNQISGWTVDKTNTNTESNSKPKTGAEIFGVIQKELPTFHFGTGKQFNSHTDPLTPFDKEVIQTTKFLLPTPPKSSNSTQKKSFELSQTEIASITGEEGEETKFCEKTKAYALVTENGQQSYAELALGDIRVNYQPDLNIARIILRKDSQNIAINSRVFKEMKPQLKGKNVTILVQSCGDNPDKPKLEIRVLRFTTEEISRRFINVLNGIISKM